MDLNQKIKEGLILPLAHEKITMTVELEIHNTSFLISPTMHLFPLAGQMGSCGVSGMINFEIKIWNNEKLYQSIQSYMSVLN